MCDECGCATREHSHSHDHDHDHGHSHDRDAGSGEANAGEKRLVLERKILVRNDEQAERNRQWLRERGIVAINMISSPGSGKTLLLEKTLDRLKDQVQCAVIAGDQRTDNDARRLEGRGSPVIQIETGNACHLDADTVGRRLPDAAGDGIKLLFIENVGNLVCPAAFDLGESFKVALLSTTEGEDKPVKYPSLFSQVPVAVVTKTDLVPHLDWDMDLCRSCLRQVNPGMFVFELSARTGEGLDAWIDYLLKLG